MNRQQPSCFSRDAVRAARVGNEVIGMEFSTWPRLLDSYGASRTDSLPRTVSRMMNRDMSRANRDKFEIRNSKWSTGRGLGGISQIRGQISKSARGKTLDVRSCRAWGRVRACPTHVRVPSSDSIGRRTRVRQPHRTASRQRRAIHSGLLQGLWRPLRSSEASCWAEP